MDLGPLELGATHILFEAARSVVLGPGSSEQTREPSRVMGGETWCYLLSGARADVWTGT